MVNKKQMKKNLKKNLLSTKYSSDYSSNHSSDYSTYYSTDYLSQYSTDLNSKGGAQSTESACAKLDVDSEQIPAELIRKMKDCVEEMNENLSSTITKGRNPVFNSTDPQTEALSLQLNTTGADSGVVRTLTNNLENWALKGTETIPDFYEMKKMTDDFITKFDQKRNANQTPVTFSQLKKEPSLLEYVKQKRKPLEDELSLMNSNILQQESKLTSLNNEKRQLNLNKQLYKGKKKKTEIDKELLKEIEDKIVDIESQINTNNTELDEKKSNPKKRDIEEKLKKLGIGLETGGRILFEDFKEIVTEFLRDEKDKDKKKQEKQKTKKNTQLVQAKVWQEDDNTLLENWMERNSNYKYLRGFTLKMRKKFLTYNRDNYSNQNPYLINKTVLDIILNITTDQLEKDFFSWYKEENRSTGNDDFFDISELLDLVKLWVENKEIDKKILLEVEEDSEGLIKPTHSIESSTKQHTLAHTGTLQTQSNKLETRSQSFSNLGSSDPNSSDRLSFSADGNRPDIKFNTLIREDSPADTSPADTLPADTLPAPPNRRGGNRKKQNRKKAVLTTSPTLSLLESSSLSQSSLTKSPLSESSLTESSTLSESSSPSSLSSSTYTTLSTNM